MRAVMNLGRLLQYDNPHEIYNHPRTRFVAGFMGSPPMNFLDGELSAENGAAVFRGDRFSYPLPDELAHRLKRSPSPAVTLGIRPEAIDVATQSRGPDWQEGTVYIEEPIGSDLFLTVDLQGRLIKARTNPDFQTGPGAKVFVRFNPRKLHAFDVGSGDALT
jgi:multiple sugar transport system ATP-binding protein